MPIFKQTGFPDIRLLTVTINEPITLHYIVRHNKHTAEPILLFLLREIDGKVIRPSCFLNDKSEKTEQCVRTLINSLAKEHLWTSPEELKALKTVNILPLRTPKAALITSVVFIDLLRHFEMDIKALAIEAVLITLQNETNLLHRTMMGLKAAIAVANRKYKQPSSNEHTVTMLKKMIPSYPPVWQPYFFTNPNHNVTNTPVIDFKTALLLTQLIANPRHNASILSWISLIPTNSRIIETFLQVQLTQLVSRFQSLKQIVQNDAELHRRLLKPQNDDLLAEMCTNSDDNTFEQNSIAAMNSILNRFEPNKLSSQRHILSTIDACKLQNERLDQLQELINASKLKLAQEIAGNSIHIPSTDSPHNNITNNSNNNTPNDIENNSKDNSPNDTENNNSNNNTTTTKPTTHKPTHSTTTTTHTNNNIPHNEKYPYPHNGVDNGDQIPDKLPPSSTIVWRRHVVSLDDHITSSIAAPPIITTPNAALMTAYSHNNNKDIDVSDGDNLIAIAGHPTPPQQQQQQHSTPQTTHSSSHTPENSGNPAANKPGLQTNDVNNYTDHDPSFNDSTAKSPSIIEATRLLSLPTSDNKTPSNIVYKTVFCHTKQFSHVFVGFSSRPENLTNELPNVTRSPPSVSFFNEEGQIGLDQFIDTDEAVVSRSRIQNLLKPHSSTTSNNNDSDNNNNNNNNPTNDNMDNIDTGTINTNNTATSITNPSINSLGLDTTQNTKPYANTTILDDSNTNDTTINPNNNNQQLQLVPDFLTGDLVPVTEGSLEEKIDQIIHISISHQVHCKLHNHLSEAGLISELRKLLPFGRVNYSPLASQLAYSALQAPFNLSKQVEVGSRCIFIPYKPATISFIAFSFLPPLSSHMKSNFDLFNDYPHHMLNNARTQLPLQLPPVTQLAAGGQSNIGIATAVARRSTTRFNLLSSSAPQVVAAAARAAARGGYHETNVKYTDTTNNDEETDLNTNQIANVNNDNPTSATAPVETPTHGDSSPINTTQLLSRQQSNDSQTKLNNTASNRSDESVGDNINAVDSKTIVWDGNEFNQFLALTHGPTTPAETKPTGSTTTSQNNNTEPVVKPKGKRGRKSKAELAAIQLAQQHNTLQEATPVAQINAPINAITTRNTTTTTTSTTNTLVTTPNATTTTPPDINATIVDSINGTVAEIAEPVRGFNEHSNAYNVSAFTEFVLSHLVSGLSSREIDLCSNCVSACRLQKQEHEFNEHFPLASKIALSGYHNTCPDSTHLVDPNTPNGDQLPTPSGCKLVDEVHCKCLCHAKVDIFDANSPDLNSSSSPLIKNSNMANIAHTMGNDDMNDIETENTNSKENQQQPTTHIPTTTNAINLQDEMVPSKNDIKDSHHKIAETPTPITTTTNNDKKTTKVQKTSKKRNPRSSRAPSDHIRHSEPFPIENPSTKPSFDLPPCPPPRSCITPEEIQYLSIPSIVPFSLLVSTSISYFHSRTTPGRQLSVITSLDYACEVLSSSFGWLLSELKRPVTFSSTLIEFDPSTLPAFFPNSTPPDTLMLSDLASFRFDDEPYYYRDEDDPVRVNSVVKPPVPSIAPLDPLIHYTHPDNVEKQGDGLSSELLRLALNTTGHNQDRILDDGQLPSYYPKYKITPEIEWAHERAIARARGETNGWKPTPPRMNCNENDNETNTSPSVEKDQPQYKTEIEEWTSKAESLFPYDIREQDLPIWRSLLFHIENLGPLHRFRLLRHAHCIYNIYPQKQRSNNSANANLNNNSKPKTSSTNNTQDEQVDSTMNNNTSPLRTDTNTTQANKRKLLDNQMNENHTITTAATTFTNTNTTSTNTNTKKPRKANTTSSLNDDQTIIQLPQLQPNMTPAQLQTLSELRQWETLTQPNNQKMPYPNLSFNQPHLLSATAQAEEHCDDDSSLESGDDMNNNTMDDVDTKPKLRSSSRLVAKSAASTVQRPSKSIRLSKKQQQQETADLHSMDTLTATKVTSMGSSQSSLQPTVLEYPNQQELLQQFPPSEQPLFAAQLNLYHDLQTVAQEFDNNNCSHNHDHDNLAQQQHLSTNNLYPLTHHPHAHNSSIDFIPSAKTSTPASPVLLAMSDIQPTVLNDLNTNINNQANPNLPWNNNSLHPNNINGDNNNNTFSSNLDTSSSNFNFIPLNLLQVYPPSYEATYNAALVTQLNMFGIDLPQTYLMEHSSQQSGSGLLQPNHHMHSPINDRSRINHSQNNFNSPRFTELNNNGSHNNSFNLLQQSPQQAYHSFLDTPLINSTNNNDNQTSSNYDGLDGFHLWGAPGANNNNNNSK